MLDLRRKRTPARVADEVGKEAQKRAQKVSRSAQRRAQRAASGGGKATRATQKALSETLDRVSTALSESLPQVVAQGADQASVAARRRLADAAETFAEAIRPRPRHRLRKLLAAAGLLTLVGAGVYLSAELGDLLGGEQRPAPTTDAASPAGTESTSPGAGNGVAAIRETARRAAGRLGEAVVKVRGGAVRRAQEVQSSLEGVSRQV